MRTLKSLSIALLLFCFMVAGTTTASAVNPFKPVKPKTQRIRVKTPRPKVLPIFEKSTKNNVKRGTLRERLQERREQIRKGKIDKGKKNTNCSQTCTSKSQRRFTKEPVLNTELSEKNKELIKAAEEKNAALSRSEVLNEAKSFEKLDIPLPDGVTDIFKGDNHSGYVIMAQAKGYGGNIKIICGIRSDGSLEKVKTLSHNETSGIGSKVADNKSGYNQKYSGKTADNYTDVDAISGATISSKAYKKAIGLAFDAFQKAKEANP